MKFEVKDYEKLVYVSEPAYSQRRRTLAWTVRTFFEGAYTTGIRIWEQTEQEDGSSVKENPEGCHLDQETIADMGYCKKTETITAGGTMESFPSFSPDGMRLAFLSNAGGKSQLWNCYLDENRKTELLIGGPEEVQEYRWSPDGAQILWVGVQELPGEQLPEGWIAPIVATGEGYKRDRDGGYKKKRSYTLNCYELSSGQSICLYKSSQKISELAWSPDGKNVFWLDAEHGSTYWSKYIEVEERSENRFLNEDTRQELETGFLNEFKNPESEIRSLNECVSEESQNRSANENMHEEAFCLSSSLLAAMGDGAVLPVSNAQGESGVLAAGVPGDNDVGFYELTFLSAGETPADTNFAAVKMEDETSEHKKSSDERKKSDFMQEGDIPDEVLPLVTNGSPFGGHNTKLCATSVENTYAIIGAKRGRIDIYLLTLSKEKERKKKAVWKRLTDGKGSFSAICPGEAGVLYAVYSDFDHPSDLVRVSLEDGTITRLFSHNSWVQEKSCGQTVNFQVPSLDGKAVLDGWIVKPADTKKAETAAKAKKEASAESAEILEAAAEEAEILEEAAEEKVPVVLLIHGGPLLAYQDAFTMEAQLLASAGFAVILANPRGSSCYGKSYASYESAFDGTAATDLLYYMDRALDAYPWMDRERLGVAGGSYGGYMSAWLAGHCDRFKAAVVMRGLLSFQYLYLISQAAGAPGMYEETEAFADLLMKIVRESPNTYAENMNIPMLIMHGEKDVNCPVEGAYQLYAGVKDTHPDLPVKLILFPNTGHGISSGRLDYYERYEQELVDWMQRYL